MQDIEAFWAERAATLDWYQPWQQVLDRSDAPFFRWFCGGKTNIVLNALDRHVHTPRRNKLALIWEGEPGDRQTYSYWQLWQETNRYANLLRGLGVGKGDRVTIYMGRTPELVIAMLACVKLGAVHSVVYGGFSEQALADRIADAQSRVVITSDGAWLRGNIVRLKDIVGRGRAALTSGRDRRRRPSHRPRGGHAARPRLLAARAAGPAARQAGL